MRGRRGLLAVAALLLLGFLSATAGVRAAFSDEALPGVKVGELDVGGKSEAEIRSLLEAQARRGVTVIAGTRRLRVDGRAAGRRIDVETTVEQAMEAGRSGPLGGLLDTATLAAGTGDVEPTITVDADRLARTVDELAAKVDRPAAAGAITVDPVSLEVTTGAPRSGRTVDRRRLRRDLRAALLEGERRVTARIAVRRAATPAEVEKVAQAAREYLETSLFLEGGKESVTLSPQQLAPVLALRVRGDDKVTLGAEPEQLKALLGEVAEEVDQPAKPPAFSAPARGGVVDGKGDVTWRPRRAKVTVRPGRAGRTVDREQLAVRIGDAIRAGRHRASLTLRRIEPAVTAQQARRAKYLIGTFTTYYTPAPRVTNIRLIAKAVDGTVIAPGGTFSLNGVAGERTKEGGYVKAPFIADGKLEDTIGGGVSQFSTTMYNAAFFAGLRLDAHTAHSFFIDRYPPGRESTLNFPDIDLRWTNDTETPVLVRASSDGGSVTVRLFGDNGRRRVRAITGDREPVDGRDFAITVTREIRYADGREVRQPVTTTYDNPPED